MSAWPLSSNNRSQGASIPSWSRASRCRSRERESNAFSAFLLPPPWFNIRDTTSSPFCIQAPTEEVSMRLFLTLFLLLSVISIAAAQDQQLAHIGDFKVESGEVIHDCVVGYRTFGTLNPQKSNM